MEMFLTVEQTAIRLQLSPLTVRRQLARGALRGVKRGRVWRVPESALGEATPSVSVPRGSEWAQAAKASAPLYAQSLASGGHLTAITDAAGGFYEANDSHSDSHSAAARLFARLSNPQTHNAAILEIAKAPAKVRAIIDSKSQAAAAAFYATPEGEAELADWRALDGEPFDLGEIPTGENE